MGVVLLLLSLAMIVGGIAAAYSGSLIIMVERGWAMVIAGTVAASAGAVLLGLSVVSHRLRRLQLVATAFRADHERARELPLVAAAPAPPPDFPVADASPPAEGHAPSFRPDEFVIGRYEQGGSAYEMYADGTILAETPSGSFRFGSLEEMRDYTGAAEAAPSGPPVQASAKA